MGKGPWGPSKRDNKDNNNNCYTLNEHMPVQALAWCGFYQISWTGRKLIRKRGSELVSDMQVAQSVLSVDLRPGALTGNSSHHCACSARSQHLVLRSLGNACSALPEEEKNLL